MQTVIDLIVIESFLQFDRHNRLAPEMASDDPETVRRMEAKLQSHSRLIGVVLFIFSPLQMLYMLALFCFHHSNTLRKASGPLAARSWSPYARIKLRLYCELDHTFSTRLNRAYRPAVRYVGLFASEFVAIWARFLAFTLGGFFVILLVLGFVFDEDFLFQELTPSRSVTWWLGVLGVVLAVLHAMIPAEHTVFNPAEELGTVGRELCHCPEAWKGQEDTMDVREEFGHLFQFKGLTLVEELLSVIFVTPYIMYFKLPASAGAILQFIRTSTKYREGLGDICALAELQDAGSGDLDELSQSLLTTGADYAEERVEAQPDARERRLKMEYSMLCFKEQYSGWSPHAAGQAIIEQSAQALAAAYPGQERQHSLQEGLAISQDVRPARGQGLGERFDGAGAGAGGGYAAGRIQLGGAPAGEAELQAALAENERQRQQIYALRAEHQHTNPYQASPAREAEDRGQHAGQ